MNKIQKGLLVSFVAVLTAVILAACQPKKEPIEKSFDRTEKPITTVVYTYSSQRALDEAFRVIHNISRGQEVDARHGFAIWDEWRDQQGNVVDVEEELTCEIHILEPKHIDDEPTLTLGHEMIHCLYGSYHES